MRKLRTIPPFEFENWAVIALGGIPNKVQVGDMGVDNHRPDGEGDFGRADCEDICVGTKL